MDQVMSRSGALRAWGPDEREFEAVVRRVERREFARSRVRVLGGVWAALGGLGVLGGCLVFLAIAPWGWLSGDPTLTWLLGSVGSLIAGAALLFSLPALVAGLGLRSARPWARTFSLLLAVLALFWVPVGTVLGGVTLALLLDDRTRGVFEPQRD